MNQYRKLEEAKDILSALQVPAAQQNAMCCYTIVAMAGLTEDSAWTRSTNRWVRIHDILTYSNAHFATNYAENTRETFRKQAIHHFRNAAFIEDNGMATNSPNYRYRLTEEMLQLLQSYGTALWIKQLKLFLKHHVSLIDLYSSKRNLTLMPVSINGEAFTFSPGKHNQLQKSILEEFAPRFVPNSQCLYVGDTSAKDLIRDRALLHKLGMDINVHGKMPDVVLYSEEKQWLVLVEAVTSVGPMSPKRVLELKQMTAHVTVGKIFVTAFLDFKTFKSFCAELSWSSEVWIAEEPDHMIHFNGQELLQPRTN